MKKKEQSVFRDYGLDEPIPQSAKHDSFVICCPPGLV